MAKRLPRKIAARRAYYYLLGVHDQYTASAPARWDTAELYLPSLYKVVGRKVIRGGLVNKINEVLIRRRAGFTVVKSKNFGEFTLVNQRTD